MRIAVCLQLNETCQQYGLWQSSAQEFLRSPLIEDPRRAPPTRKRHVEPAPTTQRVHRGLIGYLMSHAGVQGRQLNLPTLWIIQGSYPNLVCMRGWGVPATAHTAERAQFSVLIRPALSTLGDRVVSTPTWLVADANHHGYTCRRHRSARSDGDCLLAAASHACLSVQF